MGSHYASIDLLFKSHLYYVKKKGFSVGKKFIANGADNVHKYHTISRDRGRKSNAE